MNENCTNWSLSLWVHNEKTFHQYKVKDFSPPQGLIERHNVPFVLGIKVEPMKGPRIQEATMELHSEKRAFEKIHLLQVLQSNESTLKRFYYANKQVLMVMMGGFEVNVNQIEKLRKIERSNESILDNNGFYPPLPSTMVSVHIFILNNFAVVERRETLNIEAEMPFDRGVQARSRDILSRLFRKKGYILLSRLFRKIGDFVEVKVNGVVHKGKVCPTNSTMVVLVVFGMLLNVHISH